MGQNTFIELVVRPQDVDEFEFEDSYDCEDDPLLVRISVGDIHPSELNSKDHLPFVGWHGSHEGDYRACAVVCEGLGCIETHYSDNAGFLSTEVGPGNMVAIKNFFTAQRGEVLEHLKKVLSVDDYLSRIATVYGFMRDTSSRKE